jgi:hypothetical protein
LEYDRKIVMFESVAIAHHQWNNIRWNVPLDPDDFRRPSEEEIAKAETILVPAINEAAFIDGMRGWLELKDKAQAGIDMIKKKAQERGEELAAEHSTMFERAALDSGYPERLDMTWLTGTFGARAVVGKVGEMLSERKPIPDGLSKEERVKLARAAAQEAAKLGAQVAGEASLKATPVAAFFMKLANEQREPEYFGATVKPGDSEAILLKWRLEDGRYRVIHGDLRAETVDSKE